MRFRIQSKFAFSAGSGKKPPLTKGWLFLILVALFIPHWFSFHDNVLASMAPDLLLRTIGSRLQEAGKPIYSYHWQNGDPIAWLNPYPDLRVGVNGIVSTPFLLWLLQPFARLDYCSIKLWWGIIQELFLFATLWLSCLLFTSRLRQITFIIAATLFFIYSNNWLLNLYNGQIYIFHAFVFSLAAYLIQRYKNGVGAIVLFILATTVRPFFITAVAPLLKLNKQHFIYVASAAIISCLLIVLSTKTIEWKQYNDAVKIYALEQTKEIKVRQAPNVSLIQFAEVCTINPKPQFTIFGSGCLYSIQHYLHLIGISISNITVYQILLGSVLLLVWWFAYKRRWLDDKPRQLVLAFVFYQVCELITPASRNPYNMIQWLPAVAWLFVWGDKKALLMMFLGLCLNHDFPTRFPYAREIGEIIMFYALALFLFKQRNRLILN